MRGHMMCAMLLLLLSSCVTPAMQGPFVVGKPYGGPAPYAEGIHPGIDYAIPTGTPVVAVADGSIVYILPVEGPENGLFVRMTHGGAFNSLYGHLDKVVVGKGQHVQRGQLIGFSGASNNYQKKDYQHLHFGICKVGGNCQNYSGSYDPERYWLGGTPQCFDPEAAAAALPPQAITLPLACGPYGDALRLLYKSGRD
ncbi:MAG: M23 family metallopeptidase [Desulfovibrionaceae bacterium]